MDNTAEYPRYPGPIRILHFLPWIAGGGVEVGLRELIRGLPKDVFQHHIACFVCDDTRRLDFDAMGIPITELGPRLGGSVKSLGTLLRLYRLARRWRPHILHGAVFEGQVFGTVAGRLARIPVVVAEENTHPGAGGNRSWLTRTLLRQVLLRNNAVIAISPAVARYLERDNNIPSRLVRLIRHGVRAPERPSAQALLSERKALEIPAEALVLGTVCRLFDRHKRVSHLIRALHLLQEELPQLHLLIVGNGPDEGALRQLSASLELNHRVHFAGYRRDPSSCFHLMHAFALPSSFEGFGIVFVEAAACGLPCIGTRVGGIPDAIEDEVTGILIPPNDIPALAGAVRRLLTDPALCERMGQAGVQRAARLHSVEAYAKAYQRVFEDALHQRGIY